MPLFSLPAIYNIKLSNKLKPVILRDEINNLFVNRFIGIAMYINHNVHQFIHLNVQTINNNIIV